ncbi:MAG: Dipeptidyl-peptidase 5 [Gemmatimonadaceae bacterium]|nr:Dipeptidyl-peptidase 5 [Gemmatimonadaceae bacterium]
MTHSLTVARRLLATVLAFPAGLLAQRPADITPSVVLDRHTLGDIQVDRVGQRIAFTVTGPPKGDFRDTDIWVYDRARQEARRFASSPKSDASPRWSPDGATLAFVSDRGGSRQLYLMATAGGEAQVVTEQKGGVGNIAWSPDGSRIAFTGRDPVPAEEEAGIKEKKDARVVERNVRPERLWIFDVGSRSTKSLTAAPWSLSEIAWAPDGSRLFAIASDEVNAEKETERFVEVSADSGLVRPLQQPKGPFGGLGVSPDGRWLSYTAAPVDGPSPHDLFVIPVDGGEPRNLTRALDRPISSVSWIDARTIAIAFDEGFSTRLARVSLDGRVDTLPALPVLPSGGTPAGGGAVAFIGQSTIEAPELWLRDASGNAQRLTSINGRWRERWVGATEPASFKSFDGKTIDARIIKPAGYREGTRVPLAVLVHGGPTGRWADRYENWGQLLAARGYAVLYPNIRGSSGYGHAFIESNRADWGGGDFKDVMAGVDAMVARGIADSTKLVIGGWSYGGYMSAWAVTQTNRFKAAINGAGLSDLASEYGTEASAIYDRWFFGTPYENLKEFIESSPITYIKQARTPTLILQGEADPTDPIGQAQQFYRGLRHYEVPVEFIVYPREGHGIREEQHQLDLLGRVIEWFDRWTGASVK